MDSELLYLTAENTTTTSYNYYNNLIINGGFDVWQRITGGVATTFTVLGQYTADRWATRPTSGTGVYSVAKSTSVVPPGLSSSAVFTVTTADASPAAGSTYNFYQNIEASNLLSTAYGTSSAQTMILSFWARSSVVGTYSVSLQNSNSPRSYIATYTITTANTWQKVSITVPGDTAGTWTTSGPLIGMTVGFDLGTGSSYQTSLLNSWNSGAVYGSSTQTNWMATVGNTFYITGVQLSLGNTVPQTFSRAGGSVAGEILECQRYYFRWDATQGAYARIGYGPAYSATNAAFITIPMPVTMRGAPTMSYSTVGSFQLYTLSAIITCTAIGAPVATPFNASFIVSVASGLTTNGCAFIRNNNASPCWIDFTAEL